MRKTSKWSLDLLRHLTGLPRQRGGGREEMGKDVFKETQ